jgi:hypothetical protein
VESSVKNQVRACRQEFQDVVEKLESSRRAACQARAARRFVTWGVGWDVLVLCIGVRGQRSVLYSIREF